MSIFPRTEKRSPLDVKRVAAPTCGLRLSPLQLGAMSIGEAWGGFMGSTTKDEAFKLLDAYREAGGNAIDIANNYQERER